MDKLVTNEQEQDYIINNILNIDEKGLWQYNYVDFKKRMVIQLSKF